MVTNNFCAAGGDTYNVFARNISTFDTGIPVDEAVMEYIAVELDGRIDSRYAESQGRMTVIK